MMNKSAREHEARALDIGLKRAAGLLDREIAASGAVDRIVGRVVARSGARRVQGSAWFAIAAALLLAAGLGSLADLALLPPGDPPRQDVVVLEPLIFGPAEVAPQ